MANNKKIKVAVLGSGLGSMTAAYYLTSTPELLEKYEVTVYQQGWRLGGKGASGRNRDKGDRIEEHGLHMFMGFYENAFTLMKDAYSEWKKKPENPFQSWKDAFAPQRFVSLQQECIENGKKKWITRNFNFPKLPGEPGDGKGYPKGIVLLKSLIGWIHSIITMDEYSLLLHKKDHTPKREEWFHNWVEDIKSGLMNLGKKFSIQDSKSFEVLYQFVDSLDDDIDGINKTEDINGILSFLHELKDINDSLHKWEDELDDDLIFILEILNLMLASSIGFLIDVLPYGEKGYARINNLDFKDWLQKHGATKNTTWSAPVKALYDLVFAYSKGDSSSEENASFAAGVCLRIMLLIGLGYKNAPLWRMKAGMGDTVFTPMYEILKKQRGVNFEFFHRVKNLKLSPDKNQIEAIEFSVQAESLGESYEPLFEVKNFPSWPSEPFWDQLKNGEKLKEQGINFESAWCELETGRKILKNGEDFDLVVLGISIGAFPDICKELIEAKPDWKEMVSKTKTVFTQAMQVWLKKDLSNTGWHYPSTIMTTYVEPMDTWADMTEVLEMENWKDLDPKSVHYFCGAFEEPDIIPPYSDTGFPNKESDQVKKNSLNWLSNNTSHLWPYIADPTNPKGLDFNELIDAENREGNARFDYQYWRANIDPSERYVQSVPGSLECRLGQGESLFTNLFLAGDWTLTKINAGSAEAAIESGMRASKAISGFPKTIY